jgi:hypothetical protein
MTTPAPCYRKKFQQFRVVKCCLTTAFALALPTRATRQGLIRDPRRFK